MEYRTQRVMAASVKFLILSIIVVSMVAASVKCEIQPMASGRRLLQAGAPPGCQFGPGPVCLPGHTIVCDNDAETGESGGCICTLVHACHPDRKNCTLFDGPGSTGTPCGF